MKILKALPVALVLIGVWLISNSLTYFHLSKLEMNGEIPYGPMPAYESDTYLFNKNSTSLMQKYPIEKINELTKDNFEAIVLSTLSDVDAKNLRPHLKKILSTSEEYQLDPFWMLSIVMVESRFINDSTSNKNALGLMQIQPETATHIYQMMNKNTATQDVEKILFDTNENLEIGAFYLKKLLQNFRMNFKNATIAYNVGPNKLKNLIAINETHEEGTEYYENVASKYIKFAQHFKRELSSYPSILDNTYVVYNNRNTEEIILKNLGYFSYIPTISQNLAAY